MGTIIVSQKSFVPATRPARFKKHGRSRLTAIDLRRNVPISSRLIEALAKPFEVFLEDIC